MCLRLQLLLLMCSALVRLNASAQATDAVCRIVQRHGYNCETHRIVTADGYQLTLQRIPPPSPPPPSSENASCRHQDETGGRLLPFVLMHGLIGSAGDFVSAGRERALGLLLNDRGYDVWLANARGNTYSRGHRWLNTSTPAYWNFSWHEIGIYDLAAIVDYVLAQTHSTRLHYVAHSQGTAVLLVLLALRPAYNARIANAALLAPVAFLQHLHSLPLRWLARDTKRVALLLNQLGLHELLPSSALNQVGGQLLCSSALPTYALCALLASFYVGFSDYPLDRHIYARILETSPAGMSRKQLQHFGQLINSGKFQQYDYNSPTENFLHYGNPTPPAYNLSNVQVPLQLYYGERDMLSAVPDVHRLAKELTQTQVSLYRIRGYNHIDMIHAKSARKLIYNRIIDEASKYDCIEINTL